MDIQPQIIHQQQQQHRPTALIPPQMISVWISSPDSYSERRLPVHLTIAELRSKLEPITGIPACSQRLALSLLPGQSDCSHSIPLQDNQRTLSAYGVQDGATIDVIDTDPKGASQAGQYNDVSQVEKFELPTEEYEKRNDSVRAFKIRNKLGRFGDSNQSPELQPETVEEAEILTRYPNGSRCLIGSSSTAESPLRGTVRFAGPVEFNKKHPFWIGVELDEPSGKNDGSVAGHQYFSCQPSRGIFVQPDRITLGNFQPIDPFEAEEVSPPTS